jgi:hypothetical protein
VAPVAETQANLFAALDTTFGAFANVSRPYIQETIEKSPSTLDAANEDLPVIRPFLHDSERFFAALQPGAKALGETSPVIAESLHAGIPALNASPVLNNELQPTAEALLAFQQSTGVFNGFDLLIDTNQILKKPLEFVAPAQTTCNYVTLLFGNLSQANRQGNNRGKWLNLLGGQMPEGVNAEAGPSSAPANGEGEGEFADGNYVHFNPFPKTAAPGQDGICEAGNEKYVKGKTVIGNAPKLWGTDTRGQVKKK